MDWASRPYGYSAFQEEPIAFMGALIGMLGTARNTICASAASFCK
jgi:hypothetical protein